MKTIQRKYVPIARRIKPPIQRKYVLIARRIKRPIQRKYVPIARRIERPIASKHTSLQARTMQTPALCPPNTTGKNNGGAFYGPTLKILRCSPGNYFRWPSPTGVGKVDVY